MIDIIHCIVALVLFMSLLYILFVSGKANKIWKVLIVGVCVGGLHYANDEICSHIAVNKMHDKGYCETKAMNRYGSEVTVYVPTDDDEKCTYEDCNIDKVKK